jgi:MFS family permease
VHANYAVHVLPVVSLLGIGAGLAFPALMTLAMSGVTAENAGLASGLLNTTAQVGCALGLAVLAALSAGRTRALEQAGSAGKQALTGGYHLAFWVAAVVVAVAVLIATTVLKPAGEPGPVAAPDLALREVLDTV